MIFVAHKTLSNSFLQRQNQITNDEEELSLPKKRNGIGIGIGIGSMGTREVYEEKLRSGNLRHEPTINPGLGSARCSRCLSLINPNPGNGEWTLNPVLHDATSVAGTGAGGMLSAVHGFNTGFPFIKKHVKGPKWVQLLVGLPPLLLFSVGCAAFGGYAVPEFAQLSVTSYYASSSASHYAISRITRFVEEAHLHGWRDNSR